MNERPSNSLPRSLRASLSSRDLCESRPCDGVTALGSFWIRPDDTDVQSKLAKYFKDSRQPIDRPCLTAITHAYGAMLAEVAQAWRPSAVVRVLASNETRPEPARPHSLLARLVSDAFRAIDFTHVFFRTEPRKPMRMIDRFSGPETLRQRIDYVLQDLFIKPCNIGGTALVIDDIYNVGATAAVYAAALKQFCGVEHAYSVNIAALRFQSGKDGWGRLQLDVSRFAKLARPHLSPCDPPNALDEAWIERGTPVFHILPDCTRITGTAHRSLLLFASNDRVPCPSCAVKGRPSRLPNWLRNQSGR